MRFLESPVRFLIHYVAARPLGFLLLGAIVITASASAIGVQYAMKLLVDAMTQGGGAAGAVNAVYVALALFIALVVAESLLQRCGAFLLGHMTVTSGIQIRLDMFDYLTGHQMPFFQQQRAGSLGHRIGSLAGNFGALVHRLLMEVTPPLVTFVGALVIFIAIDQRMAGVLAAIFVIVTAILVRHGLRGHVHHRAFAQKAGVVGGELVDLIGNIWVLKAFAARQRELDRLRGILKEEATAQRKGWFFVERVRGLYDIAMAVMVAGTLVWAIGRWSAGAVTTGDVVIIVTLTFRMLHGARDLAMALIDTSQQFSYLDETLEIVGVPHTLTDAPDAPAFVPGAGTVRFDSVVFGYDPARPILHGLGFEVPAGQKVGIVGPSGAGKSSILQLVQRFYDPDSGRILIDGQPTDAVTQESLKQAIAMVPQEVLLFHRSVMENIRFARPDASDAEVRRAAEAAGCADFIAELPEGYDSIVGERGTSLSGGQRQRIGIARAFLKDARIVLLDEATSALDTESELAVQAGLERLMVGRTVLAVAHRLSTIADFDRVLVVERGRIVEDGAPQALLAREDGEFRRLWLLQAQGMELSDMPEPRLRLIGGNAMTGLNDRVQAVWRRASGKR
ncbi:MAG: ABC transporter ATP-binding protein [Sphingomonas sp.]